MMRQGNKEGHVHEELFRAHKRDQNSQKIVNTGRGEGLEREQDFTLSI